MKVKEYARLNNTLYNTVVILKIMEVFDNTIVTENDGSIYQGEYGKDEVINHSYNIIDLIEAGDYVNGYKVEEVLSDSVGYRGVDDYIYDCGEIKSIVTKEQFSSMEYKVGE